MNDRVVGAHYGGYNWTAWGHRHDRDTALHLALRFGSKLLCARLFPLEVSRKGGRASERALGRARSPSIVPSPTSRLDRSFVVLQNRCASASSGAEGVASSIPATIAAHHRNPPPPRERSSNNNKRRWRALARAVMMMVITAGLPFFVDAVSPSESSLTLPA